MANKNNLTKGKRPKTGLDGRRCAQGKAVSTRYGAGLCPNFTPFAKPGLISLRAVADDEEKNRLEDYQRQAAAATTTIEEVMSLKDRNLE